MLDWEGNMRKPKDRQQILLSDIAEDTAMTASVQVSSIESRMIDEQICSMDAEESVHPCWQPIPYEINEVSSVPTSVSPLLDNQMLYSWMKAWCLLEKIQSAIDSTNATSEEYLVLDYEDSIEEDSDDDQNDDELLDELYGKSKKEWLILMICWLVHLM